MSSFPTLVRRTSSFFKPTVKTAATAVLSDPDDSLHVLLDSKKAVFRFTADVFTVTKSGSNAGTKLSTSIQHVLQAQLSEDVIIISTLALKSKRLVLVKIEAKVDDGVEDHAAKASSWVQRLMSAAYQDVQPRRNFKIFVNPVGGSGKAAAIFEKRVIPLLEAAGCKHDVTYTTHSGHAEEMAMTLHLQYDAVLCVSGDGIMHEVINGFAKRLDARAAFERVALVPIPAGSGNGFSMNILGVEDGLDVAKAVLNAIKGKPMAIDLASVTLLSSRQTIYSMLAQAGGLMAELDLGTEHLRWMGDKRFILGFLKGLIGNTGRSIKVSIKMGQSDKAKLLDEFLNQTPELKTTTGRPTSPASPTSQAMPRPQFLDEDEAGEGWQTFDKPILYMHGGLMPLVGRDLMDFPMKQPGDGSIDLVVQEIETRATMVNMMDSAGKGDPFFLHSHHYYKAQAYRVTPTDGKNKTFFAVDGEALPYEPFHVEAHRGAMKTFSIYGKYMIGDFGKEGKVFSSPK